MLWGQISCYCSVELTAVKLDTAGVNIETKLQCHIAVTLAPLSGFGVHVLHT